jgi:hypothetical protein
VVREDIFPDEDENYESCYHHKREKQEQTDFEICGTLQNPPEAK